MRAFAARIAALLTITVAFEACIESHVPSPTGVEGSRRLVELSDEEWITICEWRQGLRGDALPWYSCLGTELRADRCEPAIPPCWNYDWTVHTCYERPRGVRLPWRRADPSCDVTVTDFEACVTLLAAAVCYHGYPRAPECRALDRCRMDGEHEGDAG